MDISPEPATAAGIAAPDVSTACPERWDELWGQPNGDAPEFEWHRLKRAARKLAESIELIDRSSIFGALVGSADLSAEPIHRWFAYKEAYSPKLFGTLLNCLNLGEGLKVIDPFGGVATTSISGLQDKRVAEVRSVEYSPLAHFVGSVKLSWPRLEPSRLRRLLPLALSYPCEGRVDVPDLAAFSNAEIFHPQRIRALLRARHHLQELPKAQQSERDFFLLGLAAVTEDLSGAMKDGRALRIIRTRRRRSSSLAQHPPAIAVYGTVKRALAGQWTAMIEDLELLDSNRAEAQKRKAIHLRGDARALVDILLSDGNLAFPDGWADISCFSPPYLNCIDYTEVHKLELWLLEYVTSQVEFRQTRLGTLRSHPSVRFPERSYFQDVECDDAIAFIESASGWVREHGARRNVGPVIRHYFEDMFQVWREQHRVLKPSGVAACVVGNSTFSRRKPKKEGVHCEEWRLPILTDVLLGHLAKLAGFHEVQIWEARELRPRNVKSGLARESVVVAWKR